MKHRSAARTKAVAGGRLASPAQPPRSMVPFTHRPPSQHGPQPFPSTSFLDSPDALLKGLRCFTAFLRPLPAESVFLPKHFEEAGYTS